MNKRIRLLFISICLLLLKGEVIIQCGKFLFSGRPSRNVGLVMNDLVPLAIFGTKIIYSLSRQRRNIVRVKKVILVIES